MEKLKRGTQIIYVPSHAGGDEKHRDCERGFVITDKGGSAFCRYWSKFETSSLRTKSCSELTPRANLVVVNYCDQKIVDGWVKRIEGDPERYGYID